MQAWQDAGIAALDANTNFPREVLEAAILGAVCGDGSDGDGAGWCRSRRSLRILLSKDFEKHHFDFKETTQWLERAAAGGFDRDYFAALGRPRRPSWALRATTGLHDWSSTWAFISPCTEICRALLSFPVSHTRSQNLYHHKEKKKQAD
jgi:hypothetical protein